MSLLGPRSIMVGGWFGADGVSVPDVSVVSDGWFSAPEPVETKALFINENGDYEEIGIPLLGLHENGYYEEIDP